MDGEVDGVGEAEGSAWGEEQPLMMKATASPQLIRPMVGDLNDISHFLSLAPVGVMSRFRVLLNFTKSLRARELG